MGKDRSNSLVLSSKKAACRFHVDQGREVEKLQIALEAEKNKTKQVHQKFAVELRRLKEAAEVQHQKAVQELTSRLERKKALDLLRLKEVLTKERDTAIRQLLRNKGQVLQTIEGSRGKAQHIAVRQGQELQCRLPKEFLGKCASGQWDGEPCCMSNFATYWRLEHLLQKLCQEAYGDQAPLVQRLRQELQVEKSFFLRHLLEAHALEVKCSGDRRCSLPSQSSYTHRDYSYSGYCTSRSKSFSHKFRSTSPVSKGVPEAFHCFHSSTSLGGELGSGMLQNSITETPIMERSTQSQDSVAGMECMNGTDYSYLVRQNSELLRALEDLEKTCAALKEENGLLRKSHSSETEEKVKRLKRKNTELAVIAKRLEERARKLQEANLKVVNVPAPLKAGSLEQYKRAFARQRARDLAQHADTLLSKDKEIAALQRECRELQARLGVGKGTSATSGISEFERLLRESQREVLRLQRQLSVSSAKEAVPGSPSKKPTAETAVPGASESPTSLESNHGKHENEAQDPPVKPERDSCPLQESQVPEEHLQFLESELSQKRKECEILEHEVRKRQKRCLDLERQLEDERGRNEQLEEEAGHLRQKAQLLDQIKNENEELKADLSELTTQRNSVLEENQRLRAKLENLEQVLKHMREVAERRQQLEVEHEQALAVLKFKQDEIKRLQRAQFFAKREHEGVVHLLEELVQLVLRRELAKVRELEEKCRNQSEQFGLLSQELERFRLQASKLNLGVSSTVPPAQGLSSLANGLGLPVERAGGEATILTTSESHEHPEGSLSTQHHELPIISAKSGSTSSTPKSESRHLTPKSESLQHSPHKCSPTHEVDTASEVEELDIDVTPIPYPGNRVTAKLHVFIARYSYNPYDGPNDNPEGELPLTAGEYIYVYGDMDDDGFYEGELMDGRRGLVPSNFVERVSDDDMMSFHPPEAGDLSHSSFQDGSFLSSSERHMRFSINSSERTDPSLSVEQTPAKTLIPTTNGLDLDMDEVGINVVPYPRKLTVIKQLARSVIVGWDPPLVPVGWGSIWSYNVYVDQELRLSIPFGSQTKAVLERLDITQKSYRISIQSVTEKGSSDQLRCSLVVGRDVYVAPMQLKVDRITATSASLSWLPSNSNYVHVVSLNDEEHELVRAGCYSLCLSNLKPNMRYWVKVEARPHRTLWELPEEQREHKAALTSFTTLMAGPPDAPLDVQLERGPSPGIVIISWLPVTIDAAGTSNGVPVTGYAIYADEKKVLEVSSPTAGSALIGPLQIHTLQTSRELTVRTMSPQGESGDSAPVNLPAKLSAIVTGMVPDSVLHNPLPAIENQAAKLLTLNLGRPQGTPFTVVTACANQPFPSTVEAWAQPSSTTAFRVMPDAGTSPPSENPSNPTVTLPLSSDGSQAVDSSKDPNSPLRRPTVSISEFLKEAVSSSSPQTTEVSPMTPQNKVQEPTDSLNTLNIQPLCMLNPSSLESETEEESGAENARVVSIEEFLGTAPRQQLHGQEDSYLPRRQDYGCGLPEPPMAHRSTDYQAESNRGSDLSDILEEEEEDLYSDPVVEDQSQSYGVGAAARSDMWEVDSDEEVLERIFKLPSHAYHSKQLFSIPEVTEEEDNSQELEEAKPRNTPPHVAVIPDHTHLNGKHKRSKCIGEAKDPLQARDKLPDRVQHTDKMDTISYQEEVCNLNTSPYVPSSEVRFQRSHDRKPWLYQSKNTPNQVGYLLRREALLRSQITSNVPAPGQDLGTKTIQRTVSPTGSSLEIDIEYGTDNDEEVPSCGPSEVLVEQMSSEWWVVGQRPDILEELSDHPTQPGVLSPEDHRLKRPIDPYAKPWSARPKHARESLGDGGPVLTDNSTWGGQTYQGLKSANPNGWLQKDVAHETAACSQPAAQEGQAQEWQVLDSEVRLFVALFPYDPASMSPNPDAIEEELPFKEGQIIKVFGDKDPDGFYRGESGGRLGYVPCNMVSEIQVEDEETRLQLLQQGFLSAEASMDKIGTRSHAQLPRRPVPPPKPRRSKKVESAGVWEDNADSSRDHSQSSNERHSSAPRRMVAIFDYNPKESSPNADIEAELAFHAGDIIYVFGEMDDDGFFCGDLNGQKGLVPSNFLQPLAEPAEGVAAGAGMEPGLINSTHDPQVILAVLEQQTEPEAKVAVAKPAPEPTPEPIPEPVPSSSALTLPTVGSPTQRDTLPSGKKKKSFFSKGKKLFKKLGSSKKE
ncbi:peripheral-type benzodiazepine receptor-associated protein 1 isoform X1 [Arapaima gigas]